MSSFTCADCRRTFRGEARRTATGRRVCSRCQQRLLAAAAGAVTAQQQGTSPVAGAIATRGWWDRVRRLRPGRG